MMNTAEYRMTYEEHCDAMDAVHEGRATDLMRCVMCLPVADRFDDDAVAAAPLRGIVSTKVAGGADPTEVYRLTCGHTVL